MQIIIQEAIIVLGLIIIVQDESVIVVKIVVLKGLGQRVSVVYLHTVT